MDIPERALLAAGTASLLGLAGSVGHCTGMCGGITLMLGRGQRLSTAGMGAAHLGRLTTYTLLGLLAGALGASGAWYGPGALHTASPLHPSHTGGLGPLTALRAGVALAGAGAALYCALALVGRVPPPDRAVAGLSRWWGGAMRATSRRRASHYEAGLVWGLLPCGLATTGLLAAAAAGSPLGGGLTMLAFGVGTLPAHALLALAGHRLLTTLAAWPRRAAALVAGALGAQLALRGLATLGAVGHFGVGQVVLW
jgi:hypothetical protein